MNEQGIRRLQDSLTVAKLVGEAPAFLAAIALLPAVARGDATVLIAGETGTGKELVARAIHYFGPRAPYPFVAINCGALPDTLFEAELFGHERGAFTDAHHRRTGLIAEAEKGTVFLDEVDQLAGRTQVSLLRLLQDRRFRVLGQSREQQADVRFIAATNASLPELVKAGGFRTDLFYRLCVFLITLPPLRERKEDIPRLAAHFLRKHTAADRPRPKLSPAAEGALLSFSWPGNVRELENAVIRGVQVCPTDTIDVEHLGLPTEPATPPALPPGPEAGPLKPLKKLAVDSFEYSYLTRLMQIHHGNVTRGALAAGKERRELGRLLKKHRIDPKRFATEPAIG